MKLPYANLEKGVFLVSTPEIDTGLFFRSVVLVCEHTPQGSFGLVINKPLDQEVPAEVLDVERMQNPRVALRASGPVQTNQMMLLHTSDAIPNQTLNVCDGVFLGGDLSFLQEIVVDESGPEVLLCFGYAGWGAGQLEREFMENNWLPHPAKKELIFETPHEKLWQTLLRNMGGKYASLSMLPDDLTLN